ncbi:MAG: hypothetical protein AB7O21_14130 [Gammaproteobacteria bacterium]
MEISAHASSAAVTTSAAPGRLARWFGDDGLSFGDLIDLVNPLQHIPIVGQLYRQATGDTVAPLVRVAGGALFGGPLGAVLSLGGVLLERDPTPGAPGEAPSSAAPTYADADPGRGGWIVQAARGGVLPAAVPGIGRAPVQDARAAPPALAATHGTPRGGWIVAQAYANTAPRADAQVHESA